MENGTTNGALQDVLDTMQPDGSAAPVAPEIPAMDPATTEALTGLGLNEDQITNLPQAVIDRLLSSAPAQQGPGSADFERFAQTAEFAARQQFPGQQFQAPPFGQPPQQQYQPQYQPQQQPFGYQQQPTQQQVYDAAKILGVDPKALKTAADGDPNLTQLISGMESMATQFGASQSKIGEYERLLAEQVEVVNNMSQTLARHMGITQLRQIDPELYGTGRMTPAQQAVAQRVMDKAVAIHAGARMNGANLSFDQALEGAHEIVNRDRIAKKNQSIGAAQASARTRAAIARPDGTSHNRPAAPGGHVAALQGVLNRLRTR